MLDRDLVGPAYNFRNIQVGLRANRYVFDRDAIAADLALCPVDREGLR
jgi:hypothetical protein